MVTRAESLAAGVGGVLVTAGIGAYDWRAAAVAIGLMLILTAVWPHLRRKG